MCFHVCAYVCMCAYMRALRQGAKPRVSLVECSVPRPLQGAWTLNLNHDRP